jgi:hypothetical protein
MRQGPSQICLEQLEAYAALLPVLYAAFRTLEGKVPAPLPTTVYGRVYPRFRERSAHQAALQKLARYISGLKALLVLVNARLLQEEGAIKRTLDELGEDILFLVFPAENGEEAALKARFLEAFYQEEFAEDVPPTMDTMQDRYLPKRRKIREYINRRQTEIPHGEKASAKIYQGYSGFVHSASPHLMEMVSFQDFKFSLDGISDLDLFESHVADVVNYFVRGLISVAALAGALGEPAMFRQLRDMGDHLAERW